MKHAFDYDKLDCYGLAVEVNRWFSRVGFPRGRSHLRDQGLRAASRQPAWGSAVARGPTGCTASLTHFENATIILMSTGSGAWWRGVAEVRVGGAGVRGLGPASK